MICLWVQLLRTVPQTTFVTRPSGFFLAIEMERAEVHRAFLPATAKRSNPKFTCPTGFQFQTKQKYPMVIFVHGAGYLQNVINGWNNYYREFMFNELLTQKGYVVLDIDYRGSAGYGRDWRTDVYDFLGGKDFDDHIDAIDYMVKNYCGESGKGRRIRRQLRRIYGGDAGVAGSGQDRRRGGIAAGCGLEELLRFVARSTRLSGSDFLTRIRKHTNAARRSSYADKLERPSADSARRCRTIMSTFRIRSS